MVNSFSRQIFVHAQRYNTYKRKHFKKKKEISIRFSLVRLQTKTLSSILLVVKWQVMLKYIIQMRIISKIICNFMQNWFVLVAIWTNKVRNTELNTHGVYFDGDFTQLLCRLAGFLLFYFTKCVFHSLWPLACEPHELNRSFFFLLVQQRF